MGLNIQRGNMYGFVTHTFNMIKGRCSHDCSYCYMKIYKLNKIRLDRNEFNTDLGKDNFIFVGSSTDMFARDVPSDWIIRTLNYCSKFDNQYLFQSKNPMRMLEFKNYLPPKSIIGTTIETNRRYRAMGKTPSTKDRATWMYNISKEGFDTMVTIEPIIDFDVSDLISLIKICRPKWVNIGADSKNNNLPEPSVKKIRQLITGLSRFTKIKNKDNLKRLIEGNTNGRYDRRK